MKQKKILIQRPVKQHPSPALVEHLAKVAEMQANGTLDRAAKLFSMAYLTFTIANFYAEQGNDLLEPYGMVHGKMKTKVNNLMLSFEAYDKVLQSLIGGNQGALHQLCFDSDTLRELLDAFMENNIEVQRGQYYQAKLFLPERK